MSEIWIGIYVGAVGASLGWGIALAVARARQRARCRREMEEWALLTSTAARIWPGLMARNLRRVKPMSRKGGVAIEGVRTVDDLLDLIEPPGKGQVH